MSQEPDLISAEYGGPAFDQASDVVVFIHGTTGNARMWPLVAARLPHDVATIGVDLRGRGDSVGMPGPWGVESHAQDVVDLLDSKAIHQPVLLVGHSMGAFVASAIAAHYHSRVRGAVLVDGGSKIAVGSDGGDDAVLSAQLGPVLDRLSAKYRSRDDYLLACKARSAFVGQPWTKFLDDFFQHDIGGVEPFLKGRTVLDAVRQDGSEVLLVKSVVAAVESMRCPTEVLRAEWGLSDNSEPYLDVAALSALVESRSDISATTIPGVNHQTIVLSAAGADAVSAAIRRQL